MTETSDTAKKLFSFTLLLQIMKVMKFTDHFVPKTSLFTSVLKRASTDLIFFIYSFGVTLVAFAFMFTLQMGSMMAEFDTLFNSIVTLFRALFGDFDVDKILAHTNQYTVCLFFLFYIFVAIFILLSMFLAILAEAQAEVREEEEKREEQMEAQRMARAAKQAAEGKDVWFEWFRRPPSATVSVEPARSGSTQPEQQAVTTTPVEAFQAEDGSAGLASNDVESGPAPEAGPIRNSHRPTLVRRSSCRSNRADLTDVHVEASLSAEVTKLSQQVAAISERLANSESHMQTLLQMQAFTIEQLGGPRMFGTWRPTEMRRDRSERSDRDDRGDGGERARPVGRSSTHSRQH